MLKSWLAPKQAIIESVKQGDGGVVRASAASPLPEQQAQPEPMVLFPSLRFTADSEAGDESDSDSSADAAECYHHALGQQLSGAATNPPW